MHDKFYDEQHFNYANDERHSTPEYPPAANVRPFPPPEPVNGSPVPPPIPPVRYIPGMNVQEQMNNLSNRVNVCIDRWNRIQANCFQALDQVVGAAVNNDVYYSPDEVRYSEGYSEDMSCAYALIESKAVDRAGNPIFCRLRPAYNNETNSGARENIQDVSFVTSGQVVITAVQATESRWKGTSVFNGNPGASQPDDTTWVAGFNRNGVLRFFPGDVGQQTLRQNRMVSCIGPVFPILQDGNLFTEVLDSMGSQAGSIQAIGWKKYNGNKVFFSCSMQDQPGMDPMTVAKLLQGMGVSNAVITSYQTAAVTAWDAMPIAGTENTTPPESNVPSVPGMTGGMTYLGELVTAPIQWSIPQNCACWVISKRPPKGWQNSFTTEVANVVQRLGFTANTLNSIMGQIEGENADLSKLQYDVSQNTQNIASLKQQVDGYTGEMDNIENELSKITNDIKSITEDIKTIKTNIESNTSAIEAEKNARASADNALAASIDSEKSARESGDTVLQNNINAETSNREAEDAKILAALSSAETALQQAINDESTERIQSDNNLQNAINTEANTRAEADRNLSVAIEAEISARQTKDVQHEVQMDAITAQEQKDVAALNERINQVQDNIQDLDVSKLKSKVAENTSNIASNTAAIEALEEKHTEDINSLTEKVNNDVTTLTETATGLEEDIASLDTQVKKNAKDIEDLKGGTFNPDVPLATTTTAGTIIVGEGLNITQEGVLSNARTGEGSPKVSVVAGENINVETNDDATQYTISAGEGLATSEQLATETTAREELAKNVEANTKAIDDISGATGDIANIQNQIDDINKALDELTGTDGEIDAIKESITNIQNTVNNITGDNGSIAAIKTEVDNLTTRIDNLTSETGPINSLNERVETLETKAIDTATKDLDQDQEIQKLKTQQATNTENISSLQTQQEATNTAITSIQTQQTTTAKDIEDLKKSSESTATDISVLKESVESITNGSGLPLASTTNPGAMIVGDNLTVDENGRVSAVIPEIESGETVEAGTNITVTKSGNTATVGMSSAFVADYDATKAKATKAENDAASAASAAETAQETANTANTTASAANTIARNANTTANTAKTTADSAASAAATAQSTADTANTNAATAQSTANTAKTTADAAVPKSGATITGPIKRNGDLLQPTTTTYLPTITSTGIGFSTASATKNKRLQGIADPVNAADAVNKSYLEQIVGNLMPASNNLIYQDDSLIILSSDQTYFTKISPAGITMGEWNSGNPDVMGGIDTFTHDILRVFGGHGLNDAGSIFNQITVGAHNKTYLDNTQFPFFTKEITIPTNSYVVQDLTNYSILFAKVTKVNNDRVFISDTVIGQISENMDIALPGVVYTGTVGTYINLIAKDINTRISYQPSQKMNIIWNHRTDYSVTILISAF